MRQFVVLVEWERVYELKVSAREMATLEGETRRALIQLDICRRFSSGIIVYCPDTPRHELKDTPISGIAIRSPCFIPLYCL